MGSNPSGGRSAGPALEGQLGPGLTGGDDLGLGLGDLGLGGGGEPAPIQTPDVQAVNRRRQFQDMMGSLFGGGRGGFGGGGGSRAK